MQTKKMDTTLLVTILIIGLCAGVLSGMVGVGGGLIIVPALVFFLGMSQHSAQGTSLGLLLLPAGILAVMNYYKAGHVDLKVVGLLALGFIAGSYFGSKWSLALPQETVRKIFAIFLFYTAFKMIGWEKALVSWIKGII
ncbi:MAG: sulfite exporter TauE/SafE family protein [Lacibacter sp.]